MEYKVLIKLYLPEIEQTFDMYIPVNRSVGQVISLLNKAVNSETLGTYPVRNNIRLINKRTFQIYDQTQLVRSTDIKNGTELVMI